MHRNYGAAIAKETHIIVFGNSRKDKTEIVEARTKQIIPIITETFVSGLGRWNILQIVWKLTMCMNDQNIRFLDMINKKVILNVKRIKK